MRPKQYAIAVLISVALLAGVGLSADIGKVLGIAGEESQGFVYDARGKRNPFVPLVVPTLVPTPTPEPEPGSGFLGTLLNVVKPPSAEVADNRGFIMPTATPTAVPTPTSTPVVPPNLEIGAILMGEGRPSMVLIGREVLGVGDLVQKAEITKIEKGRIEILYYGKTFSVESGPQR